MLFRSRPPREKGAEGSGKRAKVAAEADAALLADFETYWLAKYTQDVVAVAAGVNRAKLSMWRNGKVGGAVACANLELKLRAWARETREKLERGEATGLPHPKTPRGGEGRGRGKAKADGEEEAEDAKTTKGAKGRAAKGKGKDASKAKAKAKDAAKGRSEEEGGEAEGGEAEEELDSELEEAPLSARKRKAPADEAGGSAEKPPKRRSGGKKRKLSFAPGSRLLVVSGPKEGSAGVMVGGHQGYIRLELDDGSTVNLRQSQLADAEAANGAEEEGEDGDPEGDEAAAAVGADE